MKKHNGFMRKVLARFIKHNENRQSSYQRQKDNIRKGDIGNTHSHHFRTMSQPKLSALKEKEKEVHHKCE